MFRKRNKPHRLHFENGGVAVEEEEKDENLQSMVCAKETGIVKKMGFTRNINIINSSDKKAYVIIASTPITSVSNLTVDRIGSVQFEKRGDYKTQEMLILSGKTKFFELHTKKIYVTILIEVEENHWKLWRKDRLINSGENDYQITPDAADECIDLHFFRK